MAKFNPAEMITSAKTIARQWKAKGKRKRTSAPNQSTFPWFTVKCQVWSDGQRIIRVKCQARSRYHAEMVALEILERHNIKPWSVVAEDRTFHITGHVISNERGK